MTKERIIKFIPAFEVSLGFSSIVFDAVLVTSGCYLMVLFESCPLHNFWKALVLIFSYELLSPSVGNIVSYVSSFFKEREYA